MAQPGGGERGAEVMAGVSGTTTRDIHVTIHGKYGQGPMPVEFRDALVEMVRLVKRGIDDGTIGRIGRTWEGCDGE